MPRVDAYRGERLLRAIEDYMDAMEPQFAQAFLRSLDRTVASGPLQEVVKGIRTGQMTYQDALTHIQGISVSDADIRKLLRIAVRRGAEITADVYGFDIAFDVTNPRMMEALYNVSLEGAQLTESVKTSLRSTITDAMMNEDSPHVLEKRIRSQVGLLPAHAEAVTRYRTGLMIANQLPVATINKLSSGYAERLLTYRANMIARTEVAKAVSWGQNAFWHDMYQQGYLPESTQRIWLTAKDERVCPVCGPMHRVAVGLWEPWDTGKGQVQTPPESHPMCRCTMGLQFPDIEKSLVRKHNPVREWDKVTPTHIEKQVEFNGTMVDTSWLTRANVRNYVRQHRNELDFRKLAVVSKGVGLTAKDVLSDDKLDAWILAVTSNKS